MYNMPMVQTRELPLLSLREEDMPDMVGMEVGGKRYLVIKVEMISKRSGKEYGMENKSNKTSLEGDFLIHSIKSLGTEPVDAKSLESKEFQAVINKVKSGQM